MVTSSVKMIDIFLRKPNLILSLAIRSIAWNAINNKTMAYPIIYKYFITNNFLLTMSAALQVDNS